MRRALYSEQSSRSTVRISRVGMEVKGVIYRLLQSRILNYFAQKCVVSSDRLTDRRTFLRIVPVRGKPRFP